MTKIAMILPTLGGGGAERITLNLAGKLTALGNEVHIILLADRVSYELDAQMNIHALSADGRITGQRHIDRLLMAHRLKRLLRRLGRETPFDLVLSNLLDADCIVSKLALDNVFYVIHNNTSREIASKNSAAKQKRRIRKILGIYDGKDLICVSEGVREDLIDRVGVRPRSSRTIYNPFDIAGIRKKSLETPAGLPASDYIIHVGRFHRQKRIDLLLQAFSRLTAECKLVMLTPPSGELTQLIAAAGLTDRVILPGFQSNPYPWVRNARLLVLSSDYEGFGNVIVEALICGTPVVSTDCPFGPREILGGSLARWLVPPGNPVALAAKIDEALETEIDLSDFREADFAIENVARQYLSLCAASPPRTVLTERRA